MRLSSAAAALTAAVFNSVVCPIDAQSVFINELHYDNDLVDAGEFVEIAGPGGTDLNGWSLIFYDGLDGEESFSVPLSGTIPCESGGVGAVAVEMDPFIGVNNNFFGLQNGKEGVCLHDGTSVVQFLSYEGFFTAIDGLCSGETSVDIGVTEPGALGESLQLTDGGQGTPFGDFGWDGPVAESPGFINTGQTFNGNCPGEIVCEECDTGGADKIQVCNKNGQVVCVAEEAFFNNYAADIVAACDCYQ